MQYRLLPNSVSFQNCHNLKWRGKQSIIPYFEGQGQSNVFFFLNFKHDWIIWLSVSGIRKKCVKCFSLYFKVLNIFLKGKKYEVKNEGQKVHL